MSSCMLSSGLTSSNSRNHAGDCFQQSTRAQAGGILEDYGNLGEKTRLEQGERNLYSSNPASGSTPGGSSRPPAPSHSIQLKFSSCSGIAMYVETNAFRLLYNSLSSLEFSFQNIPQNPLCTDQLKLNSYFLIQQFFN